MQLKVSLPAYYCVVRLSGGRGVSLCLPEKVNLKFDIGKKEMFLMAEKIEKKIL